MSEFNLTIPANHALGMDDFITNFTSVIKSYRSIMKEKHVWIETYIKNHWNTLALDEKEFVTNMGKDTLDSFLFLLNRRIRNWNHHQRCLYEQRISFQIVKDVQDVSTLVTLLYDNVMNEEIGDLVHENAKLIYMSKPWGRATMFVIDKLLIKLMTHTNNNHELVILDAERTKLENIIRTKDGLFTEVNGIINKNSQEDYTPTVNHVVIRKLDEIITQTTELMVNHKLSMYSDLSLPHTKLVAAK